MKTVEMYETRGGKQYKTREMAIQAELSEDIREVLDIVREHPVENWPVFMPKHHDDPEMFVLFKIMMYNPFRIGCKLARIWRRYQNAKKQASFDAIPF